MTFSPTATPHAASTGASSESVEVYRRYPAPETVQLPVKATAITTTATSTAGVSSSPLSSTGACSGTEATAAAPESTTCASLRLRWGVQATELRRLYEMHKDAYPINYTASYYEWLLDHDACMGLMALVTQETYREWIQRWRETKGNTPKTVATQTASAASSSSSPSSASTAPPVPPPVSECSMTAEALQECAQVESIIAEQERIAAGKAADSTHKGTKSLRNSDGSDSAAHTVVVGFIIGQIAYARHDAGHLLSNPTAYIGSFAVDPPFQTCGVGHALLQRFVTYVTQQRPVYAQDYLHYDKRKLIALLADAQVKKRKAGVRTLLGGTSASAAGGTCEDGGDGTRHKSYAPSDGPLPPPISSAAPSQSSSRAQAHSSIFQNLLTYLPELQSWIEDRQARLRLRNCGLTEEEIDARRFRDRLAPDVLTDEEADEVRREARRFVVQTGVRDVWLHCLPGNLKATTFYAHRGFVLHRVLKAYYDIDGAPYDALLLHYVCGNDGSAASPGASAELSSTVATDAPSGMNRVVNRLENRAAPEEDATNPDGTAPLTAAAPASLPPPLSSLTGLRRRRVASPVREDIGSTTAAAALTEADRAAISAPTPATPATAADASAEKATPAKQISLQTASWLSPRTYPMVADIILCTAEKGQEEWRRRTDPKDSGDEAQQRLGCWEMAREVVFVANAFGLLCAVLWLAYNVVVEGKVL
ncbi:Acetyltransferase_(GNAT)_family_-_putative [Leishmania infantum]|nr:Acetyltransferase_(GNAT)_family_-_putative [Leishmania infantum]SUZ41057.1 Acetyltransferase_(GNAT)_family_-_putative [Leishmania infantum]